MNFTERSNAVKNALQFLSPLQDLAKALEGAGDAERFLKDAEPQVLALREEVTAAETDLKNVKAQVQAQEKLLSAMYEDGVASVKRRVNAVETQLTDEVKAAQVTLNKVLAAIRADIEQAKADLIQAEANRDLVQTEVRRLMGEKADLEADLAAIAKRAKGDG